MTACSLPRKIQRRYQAAIATTLLMAGASVIVGYSASQAATFACNNRRDGSDANPGDGICATVTGVCTLRAAVEEANSLPGADSVTLTAGNYRLSTGQITITDDLTITGAGAESANGSTGTAINSTYHKGRVFLISSPANVTIAAVGLQHGTAAVGENGGGILNNSVLQLNGVSLKSNVADLGAGLYNNGTAALTNVTIRSNGARSYLGGGVYNSGSATLSYVGVRSNRGGGLYNNGGNVQVTNASFSRNTRSGGMANVGGSATLSDVAFVWNRASRGGGFYNSGTATLTNVTLAENVGDLAGGGLYNIGTATLINVTVSCNHCDVDYCSPASSLHNGGSMTLQNSMIALNWGGNCAGGMTSLGHNLESSMDCGFTATGDIRNASPAFTDPRTNGGFSETQALLPGSPGIDAGDNSVCPATDQRGFPRPVDGNGDSSAVCDIGAYERQP